MRMTKWQRGQFIAWDSEGITLPDGEHITVCVGNSTGAILHRHGSALRTREMLDFVADQLSQHAMSIHVAFAFGYDTNQLLRDCSRSLIAEVWETGRANVDSVHGRYNVRYTPRKSFSLTRYRNGVRAGGTIWDVFGFFQTSFVQAVRSYGLGADLGAIERMKAERAKFAAHNLAAIAEYMVQECRLLERLMQLLHGYLQLAQLPIARWDGAGAVAASLLRRHGVNHHSGPLLDNTSALGRAVMHGYFGGRIEALRYGHAIQSVHVADVRSAYPAGAVELPCLACGHWRYVSRADELRALPDFALARVRWNLHEDVLYPFPWRSARNGSVYFPHAGNGWYWMPEVTAARNCFGREGIKVLGGWTYERNCDHRPFAFIRDSYELRARWKREGNGAEKALKLGLNSCYGKLAQRTGAAPYQNFAWAGWITAQLRARMLTAAWPVRDRLVMICTDSLASTAPLTHLPAGEGLGQWEHERHYGVTAVQSGFYWLYDELLQPRKARTRGYSGRLDPAIVIDAMARGHSSVTTDETTYMGMGRALTGNYSQWRRWMTRPRVMSLLPRGKREPVTDAIAWGRLLPTRATFPAYDMRLQAGMSAPSELQPVAQRADEELP